MMTATPPKNGTGYSVKTGTKKAAKQGGAITAVVTIATFGVQTARTNGWAFWPETMDEEATGAIIIVASAIVRFVANWFKNRNL